MFDILALQDIFETRNYTKRADATSYKAGQGLNANVFNPFIYTIWDGGGQDILDASDYSDGVRIDLRQGAFSSIGKSLDEEFDPSGGRGEGLAIDNVAIAYYTVIENARGTGGDDRIVGNAWNNIIFGGGGNDEIHGDGLTFDTLTGFLGNDDAYEGQRASGNEWVDSAGDNSGDDILVGGAGNDTLRGGNGNDILHGGYKEADINLARKGVDWDAADHFTGLSDIADVTTDGNDTLFGGEGHDTLFGGGGSDTLDGGNGNDNYDFYGSIQVEDSGGTLDMLEYRGPQKTGNSPVGLDYAVSGDTLTLTLYHYAHSSSSTSIYYGLRYNHTFTKGAALATATIDMTEVEKLTIGGFTINTAEFDGLTSGSVGPKNETNSPYANPQFTPLSQLLVSHLGLSLGDIINEGAGNTTPTRDPDTGEVDGHYVDPAVGGNLADSSYAFELLHPMIVTNVTIASGYANVTYKTAIKEVGFLSGLSMADVRFTTTGSLNDAGLRVHIDSQSTYFDVPDFETGVSISGIALYNNSLHGQIQGGSAASLQTHTGGYGNYKGIYDPGVTVISGSISETYFLENVRFADGAVIDMTNNVTFTGTTANDTLNGMNTRDDIMLGMNGADKIYARGGNDILDGGAGNDTLEGGAGNDILFALSGEGNDRLFGEAGDDIYYVAADDTGTAYVRENLSEGNDTLRLTGVLASDMRLYTDSYGQAHAVHRTSGKVVTIYGDWLNYTNNSSRVGLMMEQIVFDDSTVWDLTGGLNIEGGSGNEDLWGTAHGDTMHGLGGNDDLYGNAGNDTLYSSNGEDDLNGGAGDDVYIIGIGDGLDRVVENPSSGIDVIRLTGVLASDVRFYTDIYGQGHIVHKTTGQTTSIHAAQEGAYQSTIRNYTESIVFDDSTVWDLTGALTIEGGSGNDILYGTIYNDTMTGQDGNDRLYGNGGDDTLYGNIGNDSLSGDGGHDTLYGGAGTDSLVGGLGNDIYFIATGDGNDTINEAASQGTDTIRLTGVLASDIRLYTENLGNAHLVNKTTGQDILILSGTATGSQSAVGTRVESVVFDDSTVWDLTGGLIMEGTTNLDRLYGTAYGDTLYGLGGTDTLYGNAGTDVLIGDAGADKLYGDNDNDILWSGDGLDSMTGGSGADIFVFEGANAYNNIDIITDFSAAQGDAIDINSLLSAYDPLTHLITSFVEITTSGSNSVLKVDRDGAGSTYGFNQIATLTGVTGLTDEAALVSSGNLIVT